MSSSIFFNIYQKTFEEAYTRILHHRKEGDFALAGVIDFELRDCYSKIHSIIKNENPLSSKENQIKQQVKKFIQSCGNAQDIYLIESKGQPLTAERQRHYLKSRYKNSHKKMFDYLILSKYLKAVRCDQKEVESVKKQFGIKNTSFTDITNKMDYNNQDTKKKIQLLKSLTKIWRPRKLEETTAKMKMIHNSLKAALECRSRSNQICYLDNLAGPKESLELILNSHGESELPAASEISVGEAQGKRAYMEDASFCIENENRILAGVFDGHGGNLVSNFICLNFRDQFDRVLEKCKGNIHTAFEKIFYEIQEKLLKDKLIECFGVGSTAVVSYIDKKTGLVYTATLGDSEANIYRVIKEKMKSICLSPIRNWGSQKDANRMAIYRKDPDFAEKWPKNRDPKTLRSGLLSGVNVSRAFGDFKYTGKPKKPLVISKPKITLNKMKRGDILVLACDGLKDYVPEREIIKCLEMSLDETNGQSFKNIAKVLVSNAIKKWKSQDNVTVIVIKIPD